MAYTTTLGHLPPAVATGGDVYGDGDGDGIGLGALFFTNR